jgi:hypothetical protein
MKKLVMGLIGLAALGAVLVACGGQPADKFPSVTKGKTFTDLASKFAAGSKSGLVIHYHRPDKKFDGWNIWGWVDGKDGAGFQFSENDTFGKIAYVSFSETAGKRGFIVRLSADGSDWKEKDPNKDLDRTTTLSTTTNLGEVWVVSGKDEFFTDPNKVVLP